jgi:glucokinase
MTDACLLIGDIGGTNARFALADGKVPGFSDERVLKCSDFASADLAIKHYLESIDARPPTAICLAAAGPIVDHRVRITNNDWDIAVEELEEVFSIKAVTLLNDFEAIAYSIPFLSHADCMPIGLPDPVPLPDGDYTVGVLGPGTGLGAVGLCKRAENYIPVTGEAAHGGFAPESHVQLEILAVLRERFDRVSAERLVSGSGLENIYWALNRIHGDQRSHMSAAEIFESGSNNSDLRAAESVHMFFEILGQVAGDLALTLGAEDGMYIAGGIVQRYPTLLVNSGFRSSFESKGRHRSLMERIPTQLIMHKQPGLLGASYFVSKELRVD